MKSTQKIRSCNRKNKTNKINKKNIAGKAIDAGGFGCIFKPQLMCKTKKYNNRHNNNTKYVSKLMLNKYVKTEMRLIKEVADNVKTIPNY